MNNRKKLRKIGIWLLVLVLSVTYLWCVAKRPSATAEMAFRSQERRNLIGPAKIISVIDFSHGGYDHIMIGQSQYGYTFYEYQDAALDNGVMTYVPKNEGATLYCTKEMYGSETYSLHWTPIFAFTDHPNAVTARLILQTTQNGETVTYPLASMKNADGYFLFSLVTLDMRGEDYWLLQQLIAGQHTGYILEGTAQATLELYDKNGVLIETYLFKK